MLQRTIMQACLVLVAVASLAAEPPPLNEALLPKQARRVNGVLVPVPTEIFRTLDTFEDSNWNAILRPELAAFPAMETTGGTALSLGLVIGEGFLAISAEDAEEMQNLGKAAIKLARALGVEKSVLRREKSITDHAEKKDWQTVRREWSDLDSDLKAAMIEINSEPLTHLVSLGGWLRGLEALAALTSQHYSTARAQLLYQPAMLDFFSEVLAKTESRLGSDATFEVMKQGIVQLQPLIGGARTSPVSEEEVRKIRRVSATLIQTICAD